MVPPFQGNTCEKAEVVQEFQKEVDENVGAGVDVDVGVDEHVATHVPFLYWICLSQYELFRVVSLYDVDDHQHHFYIPACHSYL